MSDEIILKSDNKSSAIKDIVAIVPDVENAAPLQKTTVKNIRDMANNTYLTEGQSYPCKYALIDNTEENFTIELDYTPTVTYDPDDEPTQRLIVHYYPNYRILGERSDFSEFDDYDEADLKKGKWKLPSDWHLLIVKGALAILYPELRADWEADCIRKKNNQYLNASLKLKSSLGVSNVSSGRRSEIIRRD